MDRFTNEYALQDVSHIEVNLEFFAKFMGQWTQDAAFNEVLERGRWWWSKITNSKETNST